MSKNKKTDPVVTLSGFKHVEFQSQETTCFEATVLVDGKRFCIASDDGHGGEVNLRPLKGKTRIDLSKQILAVSRRYNPNCVAMYSSKLKVETGDFAMFKERYAKKLRESSDVTASEILTSFVNDQVVRELYRKDLNKLMTKRVVYINNDVVYTTKIAGNAKHRDMWVEQVEDKYPNATVFNSMNKEEALDLYIAKAEAV